MKQHFLFLEKLKNFMSCHKMYQTLVSYCVPHKLLKNSVELVSEKIHIFLGHKLF
jgi:hypothetical protein